MTDPTQAMPAGGGEPVMLADRYRLDALIGRGGTAEVWRAQDVALGRDVALKLVTVPTDEGAARAGEEARLLAKLSHPALVPVYDAGTDERDRPWVVMELVVGETLAETLKRGPVASERAAQIGGSIAEALGYVHAQGLVHRDVKPANVLIGDDGRVRLTDFGIARLVDSAKVTSTGMMVGTASYLAPEQVAGESVGPPADVYALGLVLLECLTGEREYTGSTVEVALARLHRPPVIPTSLPAGWPGLLGAMTDREAAARPTPTAVAGELATVAAGGAARTTVMPAAVPAPTPVPDATQALPRTRVAPRPAGVGSTVPRPAVVPATVPKRSTWPYVLALLAIVAAVAAGIAFSQQQDATVELPSVRTDLPDGVKDPLNDLQDAVGG